VVAAREGIAVRGALATLAAAVVAFSLVGLFGANFAPNVELDTDRLAIQDYDSTRFSHLGLSVRYLIEHPFGNGLRSFAATHGNNPHNLFLGKASDAGILAGLLITAVPTKALLSLRRNLRNRVEILVMAALVGNLVISTIIYAHHWRHLFFLTAIAFALASRPSETIDLTKPSPNNYLSESGKQ